jgi:RNA polymerase sigma factor for flagellar operon FliA
VVTAEPAKKLVNSKKRISSDQPVRSTIPSKTCKLAVGRLISEPNEAPSEEDAAVWHLWLHPNREEVIHALSDYYYPYIRERAQGKSKTLPRSVDWVDLAHEASLELPKLIRKYRVDMQVSFRDFADRRIQGAFRDFLREEDSMSRQVRESVTKWNQHYEKMAQFLKRKPHPKEVFESLENQYGEKIAKRIETEAHWPQFHSMDDTGRTSDEKHPRSLRQYLADPDSESGAKDVLREDAWQQLMRGFSRQDRLMLRARFYDDLRLKEIGRALGLSESMVSILMTRILEQLRSREESDLRQLLLLEEPED